jgi:PAS domain S-box-containing protein
VPQLLHNTDELFRLVIEEAKDFAIFLLDLDGHVISWNPGAQRIFGYAESEVLRRHFRMLFTEDDQRDGAPERELTTAHDTGRAPDRRWHARKDGQLFFADGVTAALRDESNAVVGYSKIARDVTDRFLSERRLAVQLALTNLLTTDRSFADTARSVMQTICENLGWDIGALWRVDDDVLHAVDVWSAPSVDPAAAKELVSLETLARGVGLPGRVWETEELVWLADVGRAANFPRAAVAARIGMRAAFAFPIVNDGGVIGVMEFFRREPGQPDQALVPVMTLIGGQIGDYFERRRTAEALHDSEERYRVITETAHDAIFTIDRDSRILFVNTAVEEMFGYRPEDLQGRTLDLIIPERLREAHRRGIERFLRTGERHIPWTGVELPALHRDGHEFPVELAFGAFRGERGMIFTGYARDISERRRAAEELQKLLEEAQASRAQIERRAEEESSFRHLASALTGAVEMDDVMNEITSRATMVTRADGVYVERIIGSDMQVEVVAAYGRGTPARGTRVDYPGSLTEEVLRGRAPVIIADMKGVGASMAPYLSTRCGDCELLVAPLVADEEPLGALVLLNSRASGRQFHPADINRARTLGDLASLALRRVRLMEQEREARAAAEVALRVRDETLGIVSHDLLNPLTTIALSAQLFDGASAEESREHVRTIQNAARQMQRLIQDLLDVARVEAGRLSVQKSRVDVAAVARQACDAQAPIAEARGIKLVVEIPDLPEVDADRDRIVQVFGNLIGNALKFTPAGGTISVRGCEKKGSVMFDVRDTGPGIPDSDLKNVFKPYWQAKKTAHMGAGLGLAIVRGIIEAHGGTVNAANAAGGGALFAFTIPCAGR